MKTVLSALAAIVFALVLAPQTASAQTYVLNRSLAGGGVTGTATLELANSTLANSTSVGGNSSVPVELVSATVTFNNLGTPSTTTFTRAQLSGFYFVRNGSGTITDINFWAGANPDGYTLTGTSAFNTTITNGVFTQAGIVNSAVAPVPTLSEWAMILVGLMLAGGGALYVQRRRLV